MFIQLLPPCRIRDSHNKISPFRSHGIELPGSKCTKRYSEHQGIHSFCYARQATTRTSPSTKSSEDNLKSSALPKIKELQILLGNPRKAISATTSVSTELIHKATTRRSICRFGNLVYVLSDLNTVKRSLHFLWLLKRQWKNHNRCIDFGDETMGRSELGFDHTGPMSFDCIVLSGYPVALVFSSGCGW